MNYRLGIDLGTSSLGWCCLKMENEDVSEILDMGVRIFPDGRNDKSKEPLCAARRNCRSARKRLKRFKLRQKQLISDLREAGLFPAEKEELKELENENPYKLRAEALHRKLSPYEIGRAIFHLNQRRGFLSSRREEKQDKASSTKTQNAINELNKLIENNGCLTLGEYMHKEKKYRFKNASDSAGKLVIDIYPHRDMYKKEFDLIWDTQKKYYPEILTDERKKRLRDYDIFYQRPLKKQETGFCSLEPGQRRAPKAYPVAQEFRILSDIANIRITSGEEGQLTKEKRELLFNFLNTPQAESYDDEYIVSFENIIKELRMPEDTVFKLMKNSRKGLQCNKTNAVLCAPEAFGAEWPGFSDLVREQIIDIIQDYSLRKDEAKERLKKLVPGLSEEKLNRILELELPDDYMKLSAKAMRRLSEDMKLCGTDYTTSAINVYKKNPNELNAFPSLDNLPRYQELFSEELIGGNKNYDKEWDYDNHMGRITNVSVHIALNQLRHVVNELIRKYGKPSGITIELGRELTKGKKALAEINKRQKENAAITEEARREIRKAGYQPTAFNMEKYKVWRNLNPKDCKERRDLYTGKVICLSELFDSKYEIEHILPYSWSYDDSYNNKIVTRRDINRRKSNRLPYDFFTDAAQLKAAAKNEEEYAEMNLETVKERAKAVDKARGNGKKTFNFNAIAWRFSENARDIFNRNNKNMARDLTDTQYMSKLAKKYLTCICDEAKIVSAKGQITDLFRKVWDMKDVLPKDYELWQVQTWQKNALIEKERREIQKNDPGQDAKACEQKAAENIKALDEAEIHRLTSVSKDRSIHCHHALDAFVLANITPKIIRFISGSDFADQAEKYQEEKNRNAENGGGYITLGQARTALLKQSGKFYGRPYPDFNKEDFANRLNGLIVSYKEPFDKLKHIAKKAAALGKNISSFGFASINKDGAFGFREIVKIEKDDMKIKFSKRKNGKKEDENRYEKKSLSCMVPIFRTKEQKAEFHIKYAEWLRASVRRKKIGEEAYGEIEAAFVDTFAKDKAFKWHESDGNYAAQIYMINKNDKFAPNKNEAWSLEIISNYHAFERGGKFFWKDVYPTAKLITTIRNNDVIEAVFRGGDDLKTGYGGIGACVREQFRKQPEKRELKLLFRVKKMSGSSIFLRPLHIAQEDGDTKSWACGIGKFKRHGCRKVRVSAIGQVMGN